MEGEGNPALGGGCVALVSLQLFVPDQEMCFFCSRAQENEKRKS